MVFSSTREGIRNVLSQLDSYKVRQAIIEGVQINGYQPSLSEIAASLRMTESEVTKQLQELARDNQIVLPQKPDRNIGLPGVQFRIQSSESQADSQEFKEETTEDGGRLLWKGTLKVILE